MKKALLVTALAASFALGYAVNSLVSPKPMPEKGRVTGVGGIFFKAKSPKTLKAWYSKNLGLSMDQYGTLFEWRLAADSTRVGTTQWSLFNEKTSYFLPSAKDFMINYRVNNLELLVSQLKKDSVTILDTMLTVEYGKFIHIIDPEGNKIELWEPIDWKFDHNGRGITK
jgi:predicted enzyme related to lactoylglutathione lyase